MNAHPSPPRFAIPVIVALLLLAAQTAFAQARNRFVHQRPASSRAAAPPAMPPHSTVTPRDALQRSAPSRAAVPKVGEESDLSLPLDLPREPYLLRRGLYVYPAPYSPDYFSPLMRRFPDYSDPRGRYYTRESYYAPLYAGCPNGGGACPPEAYYPPPAYGYGQAPYGSFYGAYEQGRYDADHEYAWYICAQRAGMLLNQYREMFEEGIVCFRDGRYDWAVIKLLAAAEKNQANAASRLHAGHALFALARYDEAAKLIARAFELSPSLWAKRYDIRDEYGDKTDFDRHLAALKAYVESHPNSAGAVTLLGYVTFYSEGPGAAYPYLKRAAQLDPKSYFIPRLLDLSYAASGMPAKPAEAAPQTAPPAARSALPPSPGAPQREGGLNHAAPRDDSGKTKSTPVRPGAASKDRPMAV
jgi:tetratricopeptide (TPR) repeat protein